jgi:hypothetical protein
MQEGEIKERIRSSLKVYETALQLEEDEQPDRDEVFHKCFQLLTQLPQLAPSCPAFILSHMLRLLRLGQERWGLHSSRRFLLKL